ncbi:MAG: hypothetical protein RLO51_07630 [Thalassobaculum sp.]|uniref:hypothetical protein n=1 Tax=Thalassobaculum sp. TaxID=2022740 RepID=UPI0032EEE73D
MTNGERAQASIEAVEQQILASCRGQPTISAAGIVHLRSMLTGHADEIRSAKAGDSTLRAAASRSSAAVAAHLADIVCPILLSRFATLLPISDGIGIPRAADEAAAADYADALASVFAWEGAVGPDSRLRGAIQGRLSSVTRSCRARIESHLDVTSDDDFPDVRLLARDILRIEAVEWAVEIAGGPSHAAELRHLAHHAARQAIQWSGRVFERFRAGPDEFTHFDAVATLSAVDDLLVVILRVLESDRDDRAAGSHPFVLTLGEQALQDFGSGLEQMTRRYLAIVDVHLLADGPSGDFVLSVLQLLQRVLRLGHALLRSVDVLEIHLNHVSAQQRMTAFRAVLRKATAGAGAPREYTARLTVLEAALAEVGA